MSMSPGCELEQIGWGKRSFKDISLPSRCYELKPRNGYFLLFATSMKSNFYFVARTRMGLNEERAHVPLFIMNKGIE